MCIRLFLKEPEKSTMTLILLDCLLADAGSTVKSEGFEAVRSHLSIFGYPSPHIRELFSHALWKPGLFVMCLS